jgi:Acyl-CoA thioester hydrolase/BAAT N-terminal region
MCEPVGASVVTLNVHPSIETLVDEPIQIWVTGLIPGQQVSVTAFIVEDGNKFFSCGRYEADGRGLVDLESMESFGGTYNGARLLYLTY